MEKVPESKLLPGKLPAAVQVSHLCAGSGILVGQVSNMHRGVVRGEVVRLNNVRDFRASNTPASVRTWKGKDCFPEREEIMTDLTFEADELFEEAGPSSFSGVSHPAEPIDTDLMKTVYVPISQNKSDAACLMKSLSIKGPFLEDLSLRVPLKKPSSAVLSPAENLVEEPSELGVLSSPFSVPHASQNTENSLLPPDSEEKECVWTWKGKVFFPEREEIMTDLTFEADELFEEAGPSSFSGVSHPAEPIDTDLMKTVYVPISQNKSDAACLMKSLSIKGPFLEDLSLRVPLRKPSSAVLSPVENLVEEPSELGVLSSPFSVPRASQNTENSLLPPDSEEKECVWDASLPPSGNVSPHSSIDSTGVVTTMSIVNSCASTYRSDVITSDGVLSMEKNCETTKGSVRGDSLESAKSSISRASDSSGLSDDSNWSNITGSANKPHKGNDPRWKAILGVRARDGILGMSHFRLLKRLGCGDIGSVYLSELSNTRCFFAMKVMDKASLASRKKLTRAQTEREILQLLDHPFLPTLYTHFETDRFSCLVMEYCPGGDLHTLRQRQPGKHFSEYAARFYAAEVLLALEYLHMLGVVYRDLKPENVLVRDDGHIMLSDFDLSLRCAVSPILIKSSSWDSDPSKRGPGVAFCVQPACIEPSSVCIQPTCFIPRIFPQRNKTKTRKPWSELGLPSNTLPELVAEPTAARSMSFVGTHEYLAPEIIKGEGHGSAVDWWTFGVFLHELLYGKTPFKGSGNRATLFNVVGQQLRFPDSPATSYASRDLIRGLLVKEPQHRLGVKRGATEIKQHPFFEGVNWALIRCSTPPDVPRPMEAELPGKIGPVDMVGVSSSSSNKRIVGTDMRSGGNYLDFEFF